MPAVLPLSRAENQKISAPASQVVSVSNGLNQISSRLHRNEASAQGALRVLNP